jgi:hypothetical protein
MATLRQKLVCMGLLALSVSACGGDSGGQPAAVTAPVAVALAKQDVGTLTKNAVDTANSSAQLSSASAALAGGGPSDFSTKAFGIKALNETLSCAATPQLVNYCVGQLTINSSLDSGVSRSGGIPAGAYLNMGFSGFRLLSAPADQAVTGAIALVFLDAFTSPNLLNGTATIKLDITLPKPEIHTDVKITFRQLSAITSGSTVSLNGGTTVSFSGQAPTDMTFKSWRNIGSTPQPGSLVTIASGADVANIQVVSVVGAKVTFDVTVSSNGVAQPTKRVVMDVVNGLPVYTVL